MLKKAYEIACAAHKGQVDKAGVDYINHPIAVAALVDTESEKIVALLHDVAEDTPITLANMASMGFCDDIVKALDCLTKREGESRESYLRRIKNNPLATVVKMADLQHNSDITRINNLTDNDYLRRERYLKEIEFLSE